MNRKSKVTTFDSIVGKNSLFEGNISCEGGIRIDGKVKGNIIVNGDILIGKTGNVFGNISGEHIHLAGIVEGNIEARGILNIQSTAKLLGDVEVKSFVADEGAVFEGNCKMIEVDKKGKKVEQDSVIKEIYDEKDKQKKKAVKAGSL